MKVRAWHNETKNWIYGLEPFEAGNECLNMAAFWRRFRDGVLAKETLGQYIGSKDVNLVDVYEGDIVTAWAHNPEQYLVEFIDGAFRATNPALKDYPLDIDHFHPSTGCMIEVIGNIHKSPELLKGEI